MSRWHTTTTITISGSKNSFESFCRSSWSCFFSQWVDRFVFTQAEWLKQDAFLDPPEGERRQVDLVAKLPTTVSTSDRPDECLLLIHIEVDSATSVTVLRNRMLQYYAYLRRTYGLPVLPIGLFLYVGHGGVGRDTYEETLWGETLLQFKYFSIGLPGLDGTNYIAGTNALGVALAALMKLPVEDRIRFYTEGLARIAGSSQNEMRTHFLKECYENYFPISRDAREEVTRKFTEQETKGRDKMNVFERMEYQGVRRGRRREKEEILIKLLTKKFGTIPDSLSKELESYEAERLDDLVLAVMDATSLAELGLVDSGPITAP